MFTLSVSRDPVLQSVLGRLSDARGPSQAVFLRDEEMPDPADVTGLQQKMFSSAGALAPTAVGPAVRRMLSVANHAESLRPQLLAGPESQGSSGLLGIFNWLPLPLAIAALAVGGSLLVANLGGWLAETIGRGAWHLVSLPFRALWGFIDASGVSNLGMLSSLKRAGLYPAAKDWDCADALRESAFWLKRDALDLRVQQLHHAASAVVPAMVRGGAPRSLVVEMAKRLDAIRDFAVNLLVVEHLWRYSDTEFSWFSKAVHTIAPIAGPLLGAAAALIPGVGPFIAPVVGLVASSLTRATVRPVSQVQLSSPTTTSLQPPAAPITTDWHSLTLGTISAASLMPGVYAAGLGRPDRFAFVVQKDSEFGLVSRELLRAASDLLASDSGGHSAAWRIFDRGLRRGTRPAVTLTRGERLLAASLASPKRDEARLDNSAGEYRCAMCAAASRLKLGDFTGALKPGKFFESSVVRASIESGPSEYFGEVNLGSMPFNLTIGNGYGSGRAAVALAHEFAHVANRLLKLGLNHQQVHEIGVFNATQLFPAWDAFKSHLSAA